MAVTLGGVTLPTDLYWPDRRQWSPVALQRRRTLDGRLRYATGSLSAGRPITLESWDEGAWINDATAAALEALAALPAASHALEMVTDDYSGTHVVIFRWDDTPALEIRRPYPGEFDWWWFRVKLLEI